MGFCIKAGWSEREPLIRAVFFDLGDTLIVEESMPGKHLWEAEALQKLPHLDEVLAELKRRGYKLGIITNTVTSREEHVRIALRRIDCEKYFDVVITSVDMGCNKPEKKIFLTALKRLGVKPEEAIMVGDRIKTDIAGGNRIGMKTILLKWNQRYPEKIASPEEHPTHIIKSLEELPKLVTKTHKNPKRQASKQELDMLTPEEKVNMTVNMTNAVVQICAAGVKSQNPNISENELIEKVRERMMDQKRRHYEV
jgi:HAD superfamily hydrolase (TIGR01662 family)